MEKYRHGSGLGGEQPQAELGEDEAKGAEKIRQMFGTAPANYFGPNFEDRINSLDDHDTPTKRKYEEDGRFDFLLRMQKSMAETFDNPAYVNPHGMTAYDYKAIPDCRKQGLEKFKMRTRRDNYFYLRIHPELDALMALFIKKVLKAQPKDPVKFAAEFFTQRRMTPEEIVMQVEEEKEKLHRYHDVKPWNPSVGWLEKGFKEVNEVEGLGIGALADKFAFTPPPSPPKLEEQKPGKKFYCGCKDPGRREKAHPRPKPPPPKPVWEGEGGEGGEDEDDGGPPDEFRMKNYLKLSANPDNAPFRGEDDEEEAFTDNETDGEADPGPPTPPMEILFPKKSF